jgi:hypothetical protein
VEENVDVSWHSILFLEASCDILDLNIRWDLSNIHIDRNHLSLWPSQPPRMMKEKEREVVRYDPKLLDDSGELSKINEVVGSSIPNREPSPL